MWGQDLGHRSHDILLAIYEALLTSGAKSARHCIAYSLLAIKQSSVSQIFKATYSPSLHWMVPS